VLAAMKDTDLVAAIDELLSNMWANETRAANDQDAHRIRLFQRTVTTKRAVRR